MRNKTKVNKKIIEILLNELFTLNNQQQKENIINQHSNEHDITVTYNLPVPEPTIIYLLDTVDFGQVK